jgi:O-antigen/teichoic acid export membrane protein
MNAEAAAAAPKPSVARNTLILMMAQAVGMPLAMLVNIVAARYLGPAEYGQFFILSTFATLAFLFVDWGLSAVIPARIANDRSHAGLYVGTALTWMSFASFTATLSLAAIFHLRGEAMAFQVSLVLVCVGQAMSTLVRAGTDAIRGFERTDVAAYAQVGAQMLTMLFALPALFLGGRLNAYLIAMAAAWCMVLFAVKHSFRSTGITSL